ncbi:MAG: glucosyl-3-phosphoglycerate synthase [Methanosarcinaceae archaeon]
MDFIQERVTTIHDFCIDNNKMSERLCELALVRPPVVIIPMLYQEVENKPLSHIVDKLNECRYIKQVVIALAADDIVQYKKVLYFFKDMKLPHLIIWCNGPRITAILEELKEKELDITSFKGKGKDVWIAIGVASLNSFVIALHDADIATYSKELPAKMLYPIVEPELDFFFNKGYYARIDVNNGLMHGRVFRLFVRPLLESLQVNINYESYILQYLEAFKYTLSGEFAMRSDLALNIRIPGDWGLEVGFLAEVYRNTALKKICQIDLGYYEHKHNKVGIDINEGLLKMVSDILTTFLRIIAETTSTPISKQFLHSIRVKYKRLAQDLIRQYYADALCNGLNYNRHMEEMYVDAFSEVIMDAGKKYLKDSPEMLMPDWTRALAAMPDLRKKLRDAALKDARACRESSQVMET